MVVINSKNIEVSVSSFLALVEDNAVLEKINRLREMIVSIDADVIECARKWHWIMYKAKKQFCGIDIYTNYFVLMIKLNDNEFESEKFDMLTDCTPRQSKIKIHSDTDIDQLFEIIKMAHQRLL